MYIVRALMGISGWKDSDAKANALDLLNIVTSSTFIVSLFTCIAVRTDLDLISKRLQKQGTYLRDALGHIENIIATLKDDRINSKQRFATTFNWICDSISILRLEIEQPSSSTSVYRQDPDLQNTGLFQFSDDVLQQLDFRFYDKNKKCCKL